MNAIQAMTERRSVRSFDGKGLSESQREAMLEAIATSFSPFGSNVTIRLKHFDLKEGYRPSTYGMIKGATDFFLIAMDNDEASAVTAGFMFEQVVLKAWQAGLGTCWIAATFKGSDFDRDEVWPEGQELKIICPVGVPARQSFVERIARISVGSNRRKPFDELFFYGYLNHPVPADNRFRQALEMLRLAPSSTNSQPWRAIVVDNCVHFCYLQKSKYSVLDLSIGISHFYLTEHQRGKSGKFFKSPYFSPPSPLHYLISYCPDSA